MKNAAGLGVEDDKLNPTGFDEITASKLRLEMDGDGEYSTGILEWRVYDSGKSPAFPRRKEEATGHYFRLYLGPDGEYCGKVVREHTAAINNRIREELERQFKAGKVTVSSCSTTMELGVDIGELEAVVCRNVLPGIQNYQQRTAPVSVTVAQNRN